MSNNKSKKESAVNALLLKVAKMDMTCEEIRTAISRIREALGEPEEVCPDEVASEKALNTAVEEMILVGMADQNKTKGEA
jgi:hypothetical protein